MGTIKKSIRWILFFLIVIAFLLDIDVLLSINIDERPGFFIGFILAYVLIIWLIFFFTKEKKEYLAIDNFTNQKHKTY